MSEQVDSTEHVKIDYDPSDKLQWDDNGVGQLTGSALKFTSIAPEQLEVIEEEKTESTDAPNEEIPMETDVKQEVEESAAPVDETVELPSEVTDKDWPDGTLAAGYSLCQNCGIRGQTDKFIRAGKFCSSDCAKSSALTVKSLACGSGSSSLTGKPHDSSSFHHHHRTQLYPSSNNTTADASSSVTFHGESILKKQRPNNYPIQSSPRQSNKLAIQSKLNSDSNVDTVSQRSHKRSIDSSENHFSSNVKHRHSSKKSKLKHRHALTLKSIESLVHDNNISGLLDSNSITNDSEKLSLPSSPASSLVNITPGSALYQSIFSMKIQQHQQEPPLGWDKHSRNLANIINTIKPSDVLKWNSCKVGDFVNSIPGCSHTGRHFMDQMIDGEAFLLLTQSDLVRHLDIKLGPAIKIHNTIILIRDAMEV